MAERFWRLVFRRTQHRHETYEVSMPWLVYVYFVPDWIARVLGRVCIRCECSICGATAYPTLRIPRWGSAPEPEGGRHPLRVAFMEAHEHPGVNQNPLSWARPLRNPAALREGDLEEIAGVAVSRAQRDAVDG